MDIKDFKKKFPVIDKANSYFIRSLKIRDDMDIKSLPSGLWVNYMEIQNIPLTHLPDDLIVSNLMIVHCNKLLRIPEIRLDSLSISCCENLKDIKALVGESFSIVSCPNIKTLPNHLAKRNHLDLSGCYLDPLSEKIKKELIGNFSIKEENNLSEL